MATCNDCVHLPVCDALELNGISKISPSQCGCFHNNADFAEVKHAEWAHLGGDEWCCTNCGEVITTEGSWEAPTMKYCNECGTKMDGERGEHNG